MAEGDRRERESGLADDETLSWGAGSTERLSSGGGRELPPVETLVAGARLGGHRLVGPLGTGGFAEVWEAEHLGTGRRVALKLLRRAALATPEAVERFRREAQLSASLNHPNCVFVFSAEDIPSGIALSMELMDGTLQDLLDRRGRLPVAEAIEAVLDVAAGLEAAAERGILHRDIKPSNCFLDDGGRVRIGDFGLSKSVEGDAALTVTGTYLGTPAYSSPEQVRGRPLDVRSDIFSLGATFYHLLTGERPFGSGPTGEVLARIVSEDPPPLAVQRVEVPDDVDAVVRRMLARDPDERFQSYAELRLALQPYRRQALTPGGLVRRAVANQIDSMVVGLPLIGLLALPALEGADDLAAYLLPGVVTYLYFVLLETGHGASLGKRLLRLRVVAEEGGPAARRRIVLRTAIYVAILYIPLVLTAAIVAEPVRVTWIEGAVGVLTLAVLLSSMRPRNGYAGVHEVPSRTRVVRAVPPPRDATLPPLPAPKRIRDEEEAHLGPFEVRAVLWERGEERLLKAEDPVLGRPVWIHQHRGEVRPVDELARARAGGLRWLQGSRGEGDWDAYEAPAGLPLEEWAAARPSPAWNEVAGTLAGLARALAVHSEPLALDRLWVEPLGRVRILPFAFPRRTLAGGAVVAPHDVLSQVALVLLEGPAAPARPPANRLPRRPLPVFARSLLARLDSGERPPLEELAVELDRQRAQPSRISRWRRVVVLTAIAILPLLIAVGIAMVFVQRILIGGGQPGPEHRELSWRFEQLDATRGDTSEAGDRRRRAIEGLLVQGYLGLAKPDRARWADRVEAGKGAATEPRTDRHDLRHAVADAIRALLQEDPLAALSPAQRDRLVALAAGRSPLSDEEVAALRREAGWTPAGLSQVLARLWAACGFLFLVHGIWPLVLALLFREGPLLRLAGIAVVVEDGRRAGRLRCALRAGLPWLVLGLPLLAVVLGVAHPAVVVVGAASWSMVALGVVYLLIRPGRGLQEIATRTWLVPA